MGNRIPLGVVIDNELIAVMHLDCQDSVALKEPLPTSYPCLAASRARDRNAVVGSGLLGGNDFRPSRSGDRAAGRE